MSDDDSFIREVDEEVRQDRLAAQAKRYGPYIGAGLLAAVAVAAFVNWTAYQADQAARATGGAFLAAETGSQGTAALTETVTGPASVIAGLRHAGALASEGLTDEAVAAYRAVAADSDAGRAYADLALLQAARLETPRIGLDEGLALLEPIVAEGAPYRLLALELRAALLLNAGDTDAAHTDLRAILDDPARTPGLDTRARQLLRATGGSLPPRTN